MQFTPQHFTVKATGLLEGAKIDGCSYAYARVQIVHGDDWNMLGGIKDGLTQAARTDTGGNPVILWNFPIDVSFRSNQAFGWPQVVVTVYGLDGLGRDVVKGYGWAHLPQQQGRHDIVIRLVAPEPPPGLSFLSRMRVLPPEFKNPVFIGQQNQREATKVVRTGIISLSLDVLTQGMDSYGYTDGSVPTSKLIQFNTL